MDRHSLGLRAGAAWVMATAGWACGDFTSATGEYGHLRYALHSDYEVDEDLDLTEVSLITGHRQLVLTSLTASGWRHISDPEAIEHVVDPAAGVTVDPVPDNDDVADVEVTVTEPGDYALESRVEGEVFDRIELRWDRPETLDVAGWVRAPYAEEWEPFAGGEEVEEGTAATFLPIPVDAQGQRLVGDIDFTVTATPHEAVVPVDNVLATYEDGVWYSRTPVQVVFIEPGTVSITLSDDVNGVFATVDFQVVGQTT